MVISGVLPLITSLLGGSAATTDARLQGCQQEQNGQLRLACYDALARLKQQPTAENGFQLTTDATTGDLTLTRQITPQTTFSVSCLNQITHLRVRLTQPWQGDVTAASTDGLPASASWFVRNQGRLLEFGRGLPAIDELRRWSGKSELVLNGSGDQQLHIALNGLDEALKPLRQQCHW